MHPTRSHGAVAFGLQAIAPRSIFSHGAEIGAGAEGVAGPGEHRHPRLLVHLEGPQRRRQGFGRGPVDGVAYLGPVDDQGGDGAVLLDSDVHGGSWV
ncbi:hypothetical protein D3C86_1784040 [compost metagenome]